MVGKDVRLYGEDVRLGLEDVRLVHKDLRLFVVYVGSVGENFGFVGEKIMLVLEDGGLGKMSGWR